MGTFFGIDVGTNSVKGISVDKSGKILTSSSKPIPMETPKPGWAQQHPEIWWDAVCVVLRDLVAKGGRLPSAISVSGQMHSLVAVDAEGKVVYPAILWCDQRTESQCAKVTDLLEKKK